ncbi:uncharacterized protein B0I36DRAFT_329367 [Microdochium trichocladiopsis]|uniref:Secreted protein n=1 Tax=Microdochium trichocladiopsis TaxID=1682393 RepID=A0A9P8Y0P8_9PEZI|nr:uncharacterized protein B0I36DRAFT_329367 [Microdochium trichocladiopsis]KAH7025891.1 hypothetical protein B0I36DRAFT_329367 [Microdochium trichocladiopsis]
MLSRVPHTTVMMIMMSTFLLRDFTKATTTSAPPCCSLKCNSIGTTRQTMERNRHANPWYDPQGHPSSSSVLATAHPQPEQQHDDDDDDDDASTTTKPLQHGRRRRCRRLWRAIPPGQSAHGRPFDPYAAARNGIVVPPQGIALLRRRPGIAAQPAGTHHAVAPVPAPAGHGGNEGDLLRAAAAAAVLLLPVSMTRTYTP